MSIFDKVLEIYEDHYICSCCLGRMFALLGTSTSNLERGNSLLLSLTLDNHQKYLSGDTNTKNNALKNMRLLSEKACFFPSRKVLENEGITFSKESDDLDCYLCKSIFSNIEMYVERSIEILDTIEFNSFLVGSRLDPLIINTEDNFKSKFNLLESESFKSHFNRVVGKALSLKLNKKPEFNNPEVTIVFSIGYDRFETEIILKPLYIYGRYNKLIRGIPQTHWDCKNCQGKGCEKCNQTGKQYHTSVEELINPLFLFHSKAILSKFHGAGREDIDVRMLGDGRPFILEIKDPWIRTLDLDKLGKKTNKNAKKKVKITQLRYSNKNEVISIKENAENTKKLYRATCKTDKKITKSDFLMKYEKLLQQMENNIINQKTPLRVSHRRAIKVRSKKIYKIEGIYKKSNLFEFQILVQGGTYIKELIHGDEGRTTPSFVEIFEIPMTCSELDVMKIL